MPFIHSKNFILRPFRKGDEASLLKNINNRKIAKNTLAILYPYKLKYARSWINRNLKLNRKKNKEKINFAIDVNGEVIGGIGFKNIKGHRAEIGYWLGEKYWGQGIMTAALKKITEYGFNKLKLRRLEIGIFPFNKASIRVAEKAGYKYEGRMRKFVLKDKKLVDSLLFAKVK
jgi:RimJ/RimL family protein N-acetyltransferase